MQNLLVAATRYRSQSDLTSELLNCRSLPTFSHYLTD